MNPWKHQRFARTLKQAFGHYTSPLVEEYRTHKGDRHVLIACVIAAFFMVFLYAMGWSK